jgi:hypothetical protein
MQTRTEEFVEGIFALAASDAEANEKQRVAVTRVHEFEDWLVNATRTTSARRASSRMG